MANFDGGIKKLKEYYAKYGDERSLQAIDSTAQTFHDLAEKESFQSNRHAGRLLDDAKKRYAALARRLVKDRTLDDADRAQIYAGMDWAEWYVHSLGGDIPEARSKMESELDLDLKKVGLD